MRIDSSDEIAAPGRFASSTGSPNHDLVSGGVFADDLNRYLIAGIEAQCRTLKHVAIIAGATGVD